MLHSVAVEGYNLALREDGVVDEFAAVAGDADRNPLRRHWDFGDEAPERLSGLAENGPGPDTEQFPIGADERRLDRDGSNVDAESVGHEFDSHRFCLPSLRATHSNLKMNPPQTNV